MLKRLLMYLALVCSLASGREVLAQSVGFDSIEITLHNKSTAQSVGAQVDVGRYSTLGIEVAITGTATVNFEGLADTTWRAVGCFPIDGSGIAATTTSASGAWRCGLSGLRSFRANLATCSSCSLTVKGQLTASPGISGGGGGGGGFIPVVTYANLPSNPPIGTTRYVSNTNGSACNVTGSTQLMCEWNGSSWVVAGAGSITGGTGDVVSTASSSTDSQLFIASGTDGKTIKLSTADGIPLLTKGVVSSAVAGTNYVGPTTGTAIQKADGSGGLTAATSSTDYAPPTSGSSILKANGSGGFTSAGAGTDYLAPTGSAAGLTNFPTLNQSTTGNAATATASDHTPTPCSAGNFPLGVTTSWASTGCTPLPTTISGTANKITASSATGAVTLNIGSLVVATNQANTYSTGAQDFGSATSLKVPTATGASPTASGTIAYDSTSNTLEVGVGGVNKTVAMTDSDITGTAAGNTTASGTLTADLPLIGAGTSVIGVGTKSGNTTEFATSTGTKTAGKQLQFDANGNVTASGTDIGGSGGTIEVKEADNAPDVTGVSTIIVSNGTLTDNGGGSVTITTGGGAGGGTVTEITTAGPLSGGPITTTGQISCPGCATTTNGGALSATAPAVIDAGGVISVNDATTSSKGIASFNANDFDVTSGAVTFDYTNAQKATTSTNGILTSTDWNTFNGKQAGDADLTALANNSTDGFWAHTSAGNGAARTLTGTTNQIEISNPAGIAGNPVFSFPAGGATLPGTTTGTFSGPLTGNVTGNASGTAATITGAVAKANTPLTTKGDLWVTDGTNMHRLGVGSNGQSLLADSAQTDGVKWGSATAAGAGSANDIQVSNGTVAVGARGTLDSSGNMILAGKVTANAFETSDVTHVGSSWLKDLGASGVALAVANDAGTATTYILPAQTSTGYVWTDNGSTTCPTLATGLPSTCHQLLGVATTGTTGNYIRGTVTGNTTVYSTADTTRTVGKQVQFNASGNIEASAYDVGSAGTGDFGSLTGTNPNTTAAMVVGSGASLSYTGTGTINATQVAGKEVANVWVQASTDPAVTDDTANGKLQGDIWIVTSTHKTWIKESTTGDTGAAVWTDLTAASSSGIKHGIAFAVGDPAGSVLAGGETDYITIPFGCTLGSYSLSVSPADSATTVKLWKVADGTAIPTVSNVISTNGWSVSTGTHFKSTTMTDLSTTTVTAYDIMAMNVSAPGSTAKYAQLTLLCTE